eukprot:3089233-Rhodomonas_salina.1
MSVQTRSAYAMSVPTRSAYAMPVQHIGHRGGGHVIFVDGAEDRKVQVSQERALDLVAGVTRNVRHHAQR